MRAVIDSNILIDYLSGHEQARAAIRKFTAPVISIVSWLEVLAGTTAADEPGVRRFLARFDVVPADERIAEYALEIRRRERVRLPDAIIWGTARALETMIVTRNTRDFPEDRAEVHVPYRL